MDGLIDGIDIYLIFMYVQKTLLFSSWSICQLVYRSKYLSTFLSINLSFYLTIHFSISLSIFLSINLSFYLYTHLSIYLSIYLSFYLYIYVSRVKNVDWASLDYNFNLERTILSSELSVDGVKIN